MKKQTTKELKIKDLFTLSERTNNGAVVTTLENGNKYCFGYFSEEDKPEDIKSIVAKRERKVTASLNRRDLNKNIFADKINTILLWWRDNLDKYPVIAKAAKQLKRIEDKMAALDMLNTRINNHEQTADVMKYNGIRKEITQAISNRKREYLNIRARYTRMIYRVHSWPLLKSYDIIDIYNALPGNWEKLAQQGVTSVNTELSEAARTQTAPEPTAVEIPTAVEGASMAASEPTAVEMPTAVEGASMAEPEPTAVEIPTAVEGASMAEPEPTAVEIPTAVEGASMAEPEPTAVEMPTAVEGASMAEPEPTAVEMPTAVEGASMAEPEPTAVEMPTAVEGASMAEPEPTAVEMPTAVEGVKMWLMSTAAAVAACLIVLICLSIKPRTTATAATAAAAPTVATVATISEAADVVTIEAAINDVICTGSFDIYYNKVKEEITRNYRDIMKSQLYELAELASVDDSEVFAALEATETATETPESVPTVETIEDTENTPESVEIMPTETDTETDMGTVSDNTEIDYNSSEYVELSVITTDANGNQVVNIYTVPLNE